MKNQETLVNLAMEVLAKSRHNEDVSEPGEKLAHALMRSMGIEYDQGCGDNCPKCAALRNK